VVKRSCGVIQIDMELSMIERPQGWRFENSGIRDTGNSVGNPLTDLNPNKWDANSINLA
jgi:hypothetical protein